MTFGIAVLGTKDKTVITTGENVWVKSYDPDGEEGTLLEFTNDEDEALVYATRHQALETILRVSTVRPCNREGRLNRPLSDEYDVAVRELSEAA